MVRGAVVARPGGRVREASTSIGGNPPGRVYAPSPVSCGDDGHVQARQRLRWTASEAHGVPAHRPA